MSIRTFWTILIKIIGIWLFLGTLTTLPQLFSSVLYVIASMNNSTVVSVIVALIVVLLIVGVFYFILRFCVFHTDWIINKLDLEKSEEERIELNMHRSTLLAIAVIVIGGVLFVNNLPSLANQIFSLIQLKTTLGGFTDKFNYSWMVIDASKCIIGFLLMFYNRRVVSLIERYRRGNPATANNS